MKWQAHSGFYFRVAGGYFSVIPHDYNAWPIVPALLDDDPYVPGYADQFKACLAAHDVSAVMSPRPNTRAMRSYAPRPEPRRNMLAEWFSCA
jgi:hypothetical protein